MLKVLLSGVLILLLSQPLFAEDKEFSIYQGMISSAGKIPKFIIVNEREITLAGDIKVMDSKERDATLSDLKTGKWVYIVSEHTPDGPVAKKIYIIPKHVSKWDKHNYPFMEKEEKTKHR